MKKQTKSKSANKKRVRPPDTTPLQIYFPNDLYGKIDAEMADENKRCELVGKYRKVTKHSMVLALLNDGLAFRGHGVFIPEISERKREARELSVEFYELSTAAKSAMKALHRYIEKNV